MLNKRKYIRDFPVISENGKDFSHESPVRNALSCKALILKSKPEPLRYKALLFAITLELCEIPRSVNEVNVIKFYANIFSLKASANLEPSACLFTDSTNT